MPIPKSVVKIKRDGVEYISDVDRACYTIKELTRAALRDVGRLICRRCWDKLRVLKGLAKGKRPRNSNQFWVRKIEADLQVGIKHNTWYGIGQELGTENQPKRAILSDTVKENIDEIQKITGKYLSAIEDDNEATDLIDEDDYMGDEDIE